MKEISHAQWAKAQEVETRYWERVAGDAVEFWRILHEKQVHLELVRRNCPEALRPPDGRRGRVLEVGIGALGIGVASLLEPSERWEIVGIDPQPRRVPALPPFCMSICETAQSRLARYIETQAEDLDLPDGSCDLAFCYNVLDHTEKWHDILAQVHRVLRPRGFFVLGLDTLCLAKKLQWNTHYRWFRSGEPGFVAHPHRFSAWQMERALREAGFAVVYMQKDRWELRKRLWGHARRSSAVGQKPLSRDALYGI